MLGEEETKRQRARTNADQVGRKFFHLYHKSIKVEEISLSSFEQREFAFVYFGDSSMHRHVSFKSPSKLRDHLSTVVPRHVYYSSAYYREPSAKIMEEKGWLGADLVFDIDVDHIATPCKEIHDRWVCKRCGASGRGAVEVCLNCGSESVEKQAWVCETCISVARDEVLKLLDFLERDFGLSAHESVVTFSGHRGFHVHVEDPVVRELNQEGRRELVDYLKGLGLDPRILLRRERGGFRLRFSPDAPGWYGRLARWVLVSVGNESPSLSMREWRRVIEECIAKEAALIDEKVTVDPRRLIRLPNSLHGKTGLKVAEFALSELEAASILDKVKVFTRGEAVVEIGGDPPRKFLDLEIPGPSRVKLPLYAALYLLLNGAEIGYFKIT